uniref:glycosyltransferase family 2 protein n=1 Tax=uncultured Dysgonomonas sp. TaxID=206096 RepID=UPI00261E9F35|nr:glycosyltransferase family 2 protein [uncultured Dysgonomonas sp.]
MKISIIIPIYNVSKYIERCITSVMCQTYQNIEIILVNDCTPDNSMDIVANLIDNFSTKHEIIICNQDVNQGLSAARNTGIRKATGDYIYFLDSDDELPKDAIKKLVYLATKYNSDFVIGNVEQIYPDSVKLINVKLFEKEYIECNSEIKISFLQKKWYVMAWNKLVKSQFLFDNNLFFEEGIYHEDNLWSFQLALVAQSMSICNDTTYLYHMNPGTISSVIRQKNIDDFVFIFEKCVSLAIDTKELDNPDMLNYLEANRFYILCLPSFSKNWFINFNKIKINKYYSFLTLVRSKASISSKIKRALQVAPSVLSFCIFLIIRKIKY